MSDLRTAAQQALEAMLNFPDDISDAMFESITALKAALAQQAEPVHPVATTWRSVLPGGKRTDEWESARIADYNAGWNAYRKAATSALEKLWDNNLRPVVEFRGRRMTPEGTRECWGVLLCDVKQDPPEGTKLYTAPPQQAEPVEPVDVGLLEYRGNSVAFIHQKMTAYRSGIDAAWDAFRAKRLHPDGKTSLADMIAKHTAPPQRTMVPLTEEEIKTAFHAARNAKLGASQDNSRHRLSVIEIARAVEQALWEKHHG